MTTVALTDSFIRSLSVEHGVVDFRDRSFRGFGVRVTAGGTKSFFIVYSFGGRRRRYHLGRYPTIKLAAARKRAREVLVRVDKGDDPQAERAAERQADTFADLCQMFLDLYARPRHSKAWLKYEERIIAKDLLPAFGPRRITEIQKRDIVLLLDSMAKRGPTPANRTRSILSRIFTWALGRDLLEHNPVAGVPKPGKELPRERVLSEDELRRVWLACEEHDSLVAPSLQLVLLTAQRGGEVRAMRWADIDGRWWTIPKAKNGRSHRVFLSPQAARILEGLDPETEYAFPGRRGKAKHLETPYKARELIAASAGVDNWTIHDLRRTAATMMASMGVSPFVVEKILGHTDRRGVTAIYDRSSYDAEKREAMIRWGKRVDDIAAGRSATNVLTYRLAG